MKLTAGEKLIIAMLTDLYQKAGIEDGFDPEFIRNAIGSDNTWAITRRYSGFFTKEDMAASQLVSDVGDILNMWQSLEETFTALPSTDQQMVRAAAKVAKDKPQFRGFDGNAEVEAMSIASFAINDLGQYEYFKGRELNSHYPTLNSYTNMVKEFKEFRLKPLQASDITRILRAGQRQD